MPGFDRTGPSGIGPMTGGSRGLCNPRQTGRGGYGTGRGLGGARGSNRVWQAQMRGLGPNTRMNRNEEIAFMKEEVQAMRDEVAVLERQIEEWEKGEA